MQLKNVCSDMQYLLCPRDHTNRNLSVILPPRQCLFFSFQFQGKCDQKSYQTPALDSTAVTYQLPLKGVKRYHHLKNVSLLVFML